VQLVVLKADSLAIDAPLFHSGPQDSISVGIDAMAFVDSFAVSPKAKKLSLSKEL
jgi:hypothetical protein